MHKIIDFRIGPAQKIWRTFEEYDCLSQLSIDCEEQASSSESTLKILKIISSRFRKSVGFN